MTHPSMHVCPTILTPGVRTAGLIGTGEAPFDAAEWRKDDGANHGMIGTTLHVPRATTQTIEKKII